MSNALVIIDVQRGFAVEKAADLPEKIQRHLRTSSYDHVLFSLFRNDPDSNFHKILKLGRFVDGPLIEVHPLLAPLTNDANTFWKTTYSVFKAPGFQDYLARHGITELYLCGINTDACVLSSAFEAFDLGYDIHIIDELSSVSSNKPEYIESANVIIKRNLRRKAPRPSVTS
jgi:nicotinamidase-related amidase